LYILAQLLSDRLPDNWESTKKAEESNEQVLLIRGKEDRKQKAVFKTYKNNNFKDYSKELKALKILKGKIMIKNSP
jgi:hypothetical protein